MPDAPGQRGDEQVPRLATGDAAGAGADPRTVRRIRASFTGMVPLPSRLTVRVIEATEGNAVLFDVLGEDGAPVLSRGAVHAV